MRAVHCSGQHSPHQRGACPLNIPSRAASSSGSPPATSPEHHLVFLDKPRPPYQLLNRNTADELLTAQLSAPLRVRRASFIRSTRSGQGRDHPEASAHIPGGPSQPADGVSFSPGPMSSAGTRVEADVRHQQACHRFRSWSGWRAASRPGWTSASVALAACSATGGWLARPPQALPNVAEATASASRPRDANAIVPSTPSA
jgi:hypothetical protein